VVTKSAKKTVTKMRASAANQTQEDMERVALGYGFNVWEGKNHTTYQHSKYNELIGQWPRHGDVFPVYVKQLLKLIDKLEVIEGVKK
jgi:hypothetical protein